MMDGQTDQTEGKRARVRRLLIDPLAQDGFCFPKKTPEADAAKRLAQLADDLAYLSDDGLRALRDCMVTKGEGTAQRFWPERATFLYFAHRHTPRPLSEQPGLCSWFASVEGPRAKAEGRLVAEFKFWEKFARPPMPEKFPGDAVTLREFWERYDDRARRVRERLDNGFGYRGDDDAFLRWYDRTFAQVDALLPGGAA